MISPMGMFELLKTLEDAGIRYVLVGGLAVALRGYQRVTMDVDVVLALDDDNLQRFIACAKAAGWQPVAPVPVDALANRELLNSWYAEKGMRAFGLRHPAGVSTAIDVLIKPPVSYEDLRRDASLVTVGALRIPVASIDHLIAMKTGTGRGQDQVDIEALRKLQAGGTPC
jgi:predicted nucleotidyltransferase